MTIILGIETSCDETAAAVVTSDRRILSNVIFSQIAEHQEYGGVVPEIASRAHAEHMENIIRQALQQASVSLSDVDAIAATTGPGLIGGVLVGTMAAKGLAYAAGKPFIAVNHLEGHALTSRLTHNTPFPFLLLLVSGGHCQILIAERLGVYHKLGGTLDDALGEAFDKTAKMLGLGYPGGPAVEKLAKDGNPQAYLLPRPLYGQPGCDFSFSGLKTAVLHVVEAERAASPTALSIAVNADICASFQRVCGEILQDRVQRAIQIARERFPDIKQLVVAGGVAANQYLRGILTALCADNGLECIAPPLKLCTDNAAMIAWAGLEHFEAGHHSPLNTTPRARWPLAELSV